MVESTGDFFESASIKNRIKRKRKYQTDSKPSTHSLSHFLQREKISESKHLSSLTVILSVI